MISFIRGILDSVSDDCLVIDVNGIGFEVRTTERTIKEFYPLEGKEVKVYTYYHVREDDRALYGFNNKKELSIFKMLITVNGVGPKGGLSILNTLPPDELYSAVLLNDSKAISKANGIGQKTAQKIIIELKDKIAKEDADFSDVASFSNDDHVMDEAAEALTSLGYSNTAALRAIQKVKYKENMTVEQLLKAALKNI